MEDARELQIFKKKEEAKDMHIIKKNRVIRPVERQKMRPWMVDLLDRNCVPGLCWQNRKDRIFRISWKHAAHTCFSQSKDTDLFERWALHTGRKYNDDDHKRWKANFRCALNSLPDVVELKDLGVKKGNNAFRVYKFLDESDPQVKMAKYNARKSVKALQRGIDLSKISVNQLKSETEVKTFLFESPPSETTSTKKRKPNSHSEVEAVRGLELLSQTAAMTSPLTSGVSTLPSKRSPRSNKGGSKMSQAQTVMLTTGSPQDQNQPVTFTLTIQQGQRYLQNLNVGISPVTEDTNFSTTSSVPHTSTIVESDEEDLSSLQSTGASFNLKKDDSQLPNFCELVTETGDHISSTAIEHGMPIQIEVQDFEEEATDVGTLQNDVTTEVPYEKEEVVELPSVMPDSEEGAKSLSYMYLCHWCQECFSSKVLLLSHFLMLHQEMLIMSHASIETKSASEIAMSGSKEGTAAVVDALKPSTSSGSSSGNDCLNNLAPNLCDIKKESEALDLRVVVKKNEGGEYLQPSGAEHESALDLSLTKFETTVTDIAHTKEEKLPKKKGRRKIIKKRKKGKLKVKLNRDRFRKSDSRLKLALTGGKPEKYDAGNEPLSPAQQSGSESDSIWDHTYHRDNETSTDGNFTTMAVSAETKIELQKHLSNQQNVDRKQTVVSRSPVVETLMYCSICSKCYPKMLFIDHLSCHLNYLPFKCAVCNMAYSDSAFLQLHISDHKKKDAFECEYCWRLFLKEEQLMRHRKTHKTLMCVVCQCDFDSINMLKKHQEECLPERHLGYRCRQEDADKPKQCEHCDLFYIHQISHMKTHIQDESFKIYVCSICNLTFKDNVEISDHVKTHSDPSKIGSQIDESAFSDQIMNSCNLVNSKKKNPEENSQLSRPEAGSVADYHVTDISELEVEVCCESDTKKELPDKFPLQVEAVQGNFVLHDGFECLSQCPSFQPNDLCGYLCDICQKTFSKLQPMLYHRKRHSLRWDATEGFENDGDELQIARPTKKLRVTDTSEAENLSSTCVANASELKRLLMHKPRPLRSAKEVRSWTTETNSDTKPMHGEDDQHDSLGPGASSSSIGDIFQVVKLPIKTKKFSFEINVPVYKPLQSSNSGGSVDEPAQSSKDGGADGNIDNSIIADTEEQSIQVPRIKQKVTDNISTGYAPENQFCTLCRIKFKDSNALQGHLEVMHSSNTVFRCYVCGRVYLNKSELKHHMSCHEAKKYKCRLCGIAFSTISKLKKHTLSQRHSLRVARLFPSRQENALMGKQESQNAGPPHRCGICPASFQKIYQLLRHNKVYHGKKRDSKFMFSLRKRTKEDTCMVCGQNFDYAGNLQLHMLEHVDEEVANMSDACSDDQSTSSNERKTRHRCNICFKELSSRNSLNRHRLIHTGVKPYKCSLCQFRCNQKGNLSVHMKAHHRDVLTQEMNEAEHVPEKSSHDLLASHDSDSVTVLAYPKMN